MRRRDALQAAVRNAQAIAWVRSHALRDLEDLVNEMSDLGEDVKDITELIVDLQEIDRSWRTDIEAVPAIENEEYAENAG